MPNHPTELHTRVDEVLHYLWDPIGVADVPNARDEYNMYVPEVMSLLSKNAPVEQIATYLDNVAVKRMGLRSNEPHSLKAAQCLVAWKTKLLQRP